jgi:3-hydroxyisobutyrate dehydrogenase
MSSEVGFIGLGVMGAAMAGHILRGGQKLTVYNRTKSKTEPLKLEGANVAESPKDLAERSNFIFICAGDGASVREIIFGTSGDTSKALISGLRPGAIVVDHSTISPIEALDIAKDLDKAGFKFLDAPITGGDIGARNGTLTIMVGGDSDSLEKVRPVLNLYSKKICKIGPSGSGQKMKAVNQIGAIGGVALLSELMHFAASQGLDPAMTVETLKDGGASSFALNVYGPKIVNGDFKPGFSVKHSKKDIGIVLSQAKGLEMPLTEITFKALEEATKKGLSEEGNHVLFSLKQGEK